MNNNNNNNKKISLVGFKKLGDKQIRLNQDFFSGISKGPATMVVGFFVRGVVRDVMFAKSGTGEVGKALRSLNNLRVVSKKMKELVDLCEKKIIKNSKRLYLCKSSLGGN